jgi:D-arginine dehydrogenase
VRWCWSPAGLGHHASGRGAGLGRQLAEDDDTSRLAIRGAAMLRERFGAAWTETGGILSFDDADVADIYAARARRLDVPHERIDRAAVLREWPAMIGLPIAAAIRVARDGVIDPQRLLRAFADGLEIVHGAAVTRIVDGGAGARVETAGGTTFDARCVVDASGAWAGRATDDEPLETVKRHLFVLEASAEKTAPYLWHLGAMELYVRADQGGVLASPCDSEPTSALDQHPSDDADERLAARLGPAGITAPITRRWACQRAFAADRKMRIGRDPRRPWMVWAAALGGHGATASPAVGVAAAAAVMEVLG